VEVVVTDGRANGNAAGGPGVRAGARGGAGGRAGGGGAGGWLSRVGLDRGVGSRIPGRPPELSAVHDGSELSADDARCFISRDMSWLEFNRRVLAQATDERTPLLERVKFLAICASNLDEFFMKRVGLFKRRLEGGSKGFRTHDGLGAAAELARCRAVAADLQSAQAACFAEEVKPGLAREGIELLAVDDLPAGDRRRVDAWFAAEVFPVLTPLAVDKGHRFPFISNLSESFGVLVSAPGEGDELFARVKIPDVLPRMIAVPEDGGAVGGELSGVRRVRVVTLEDVIRRNLSSVFPGMELVAVMPFRVTRSAAIDSDEAEFDDLLELVEAHLRNRRFAEAVRLEVPEDGPPAIIERLKEELHLRDDDVFARPGPLEDADLLELATLDRPDLMEPRFMGVVPARLRDPSGEPDAIFAAIRERDIFVHHPYESFKASVERFVSDAADDPDVLAIKQTLYRTSKDSPFIDSLIRAAKSGKQVACLVELRARFDEDKNVHFARQLERHGVHVAYGVEGLKTHCKCSLVVRREGGGVRTYAHVGTGNYHPGTAQLYTDCGVFTADAAITADVVDLFNYLTGRSRHTRYRRLLVAPLTMRSRFYDLIDGEIKAAQEGRPARIVAKMNQLEDMGIMRRLIAASRAGVRVTVINRGFCCLRPGVPGLTDRVEIISVVGRFLEHARVFHFAAGRDDPLEGEWYIGSADWMSRNLSDRVESATPVLDVEARRRLVEIIEAGLRDRRHAWLLGPDGVYRPRVAPDDAAEDSPERRGTFATLCRSALSK